MRPLWQLIALGVCFLFLVKWLIVQPLVREIFRASKRADMRQRQLLDAMKAMLENLRDIADKR